MESTISVLGEPEQVNLVVRALKSDYLLLDISSFFILSFVLLPPFFLNTKINQLTWLRSPPCWMHYHNKADQKQQCDRGANDATKFFNADSYDFDRVWTGP